MSDTETYLASFHGLDIGLVYNLPSNVRIYLYCTPGKPVSAEIVNEARTWGIATLPEYDAEGKFMTRLFLRSLSKGKESPYCVFSGNLVAENMNRVPDLYFEEEENGDFRTGLYHLPVNFRRVFLRDHYSSVASRRYQAGDIEELDRNVLSRKLAKQSHDDEASGFLYYFLSPSGLRQKRYANLSFVVVPSQVGYESYTTLFRTRKQKSVPESRVCYPDIDDRSVPNSQDQRDHKKVLKIRKDMGGFYLSDVVRMLCHRHPDARITLVISACRSFHPDLPGVVRHNQKKTAQIDAISYYRHFGKRGLF